MRISIDWMVKLYKGFFVKSLIFQGAEIRSVGRDELLYVEGSRKVYIFAELADGKPDRIIIKDSIKSWEPPYESELIDVAKKNEILKLACNYLDSIGESFVVQ